MIEKKPVKLTKQQKEDALNHMFDLLGVDIKAKDLMSLSQRDSESEAGKAYKQLTWKQKIFATAYEEYLGNVTQSCKAVGKHGIHRSTYYEWMKTCPPFKKYIESLQVQEMVNDLNEQAIIKLLKGDNPNPYVVIARAKLKMQHRGYIENAPNLQSNVQQNVHWYLPDNNRDNKQSIEDISHEDVKEDSN